MLSYDPIQLSDIGGNLLINGLGERDQESVLLDIDLFDFERHDAIPVDTLDRERLDPAHRPLAVRTARARAGIGAVAASAVCAAGVA